MFLGAVGPGPSLSPMLTLSVTADQSPEVCRHQGPHLYKQALGIDPAIK